MAKSKDNSVSYYRKPVGMTTRMWQIALRSQFAENNPFGIINLGIHPVFSDFKVSNTQNKNTYKVAIRSKDNSLNYCSCLDFKTNCLGTCKHIEAVLHHIRKNPKHASILNTGFIPVYSSIYLKYDEIREVKLRIGTENHAEFKKFAEKYFDSNFSLLPTSYEKIEQLIEEAKSINEGFRCYQDAVQYILDVREKNVRQKLIDEHYQKNIHNGVFKPLIKTELFPYQKEGIVFAAKAGRCLLADDMGLGKTIQAIATAELLKKEFGIGRVLIICPTSLKYQWKSEIEKFTNSSVSVIEGLHLKRKKFYENDKSFYNILSYHIVSNDIDEINKLEADLVILDEAQRIKNFKTKVAQNVKKVRTNYSIVLTGTPLENKLEELYSIVSFVDPFALGPYFEFLEKHQIKNETGKIIGYQNLNQVGQDLSHLLLRRTKGEVLKQLPERMDKNLVVTITDEQMAIHSEYQEIVAKIVHKWRQQGFLNEKDRQRMLIALNMMRMVCDSTYIIDQETRFDTKITELMYILEEYLSTKEQKAVIFSQWERMTRIIAQELDKRNIGYENLNGSVPSEKRKILFDNFNNNPDSRVFLSTDAGGVGLNLQAGSLLVNIDIPWNPAVLEQRIGRIHRIGQKKNITVINLIAAGTIEHRMLDVLKFKSMLASGILDQGEDVIFLGDSKFNKFMESVEELTSVENTQNEEVAPVSTISQDDLEEKEPEPVQVKPVEPQYKLPFDPVPEESEQPKPENIFNDPDEPINEPEDKEQTSSSSQDVDAGDILQTGIQFFSRLSQALSDPKSTEKLVKSLVEKDQTTGKCYMKIPVENEKTVENIFNLFGALVKGLQK